MQEDAMKIIVVGCGRIGSGLAEFLSQKGHTVTVVDSDAAAFKRLDPGFKGKTVEGIGFDRDILLKAKIDKADALAAVTASDESNAVIAQLAREAYHVPKVVARMYDRHKADIYRKLGIQTISSTTWGIKRAADLLCYSPFNAVLSLGAGDVDVVEIEIPPMMDGQKARDLMVAGEINLIAISRGGKTYIPTLGTQLEKGDLAFLAVATASADRLKRLLGME